ncbi:MAG: hypothetical protein KDJ36_20040, partial [Hyphomicrobiaceae bacterium]|nr:hypothetical protein [Hyphomicrobiaceae bacterium]
VLANVRGIPLTSKTAEHLKSELRNISDSEVRQIYLGRYWQKARCPDLPAAIAFMHFDAAVNQGVGRASRMLQQALGVDVDGEIGPITLSAAQARDTAATLARYADIRRRHYQSLSHFWRFGRGWLRRLDATTRAALVLVRASQTFTPPLNEKQENDIMPDAVTPVTQAPA